MPRDDARFATLHGSLATLRTVSGHGARFVANDANHRRAEWRSRARSAALVLEHPLFARCSLWGADIHAGDIHTQAKLRAKLHKEENKTNASKNDDVQGVELQLRQEAAPKPSSGCCSVL